MVIEFWKHEKYHDEIQIEDFTGNVRANDFVGEFTEREDNFNGIIYVGF